MMLGSHSQVEACRSEDDLPTLPKFHERKKGTLNNKSASVQRKTAELLVVGLPFSGDVVCFVFIYIYI